MMGKSQKLSKKRPIGFVPDYRNTVETMGESEIFTSPTHIDSEDSCVPNPKPTISNADKSKGFNVPLQYIPLSKLSFSERKDLESRLRGELDRVRNFQKRVLPRPVSQKPQKSDRSHPTKSSKSVPTPVPERTPVPASVPVPKPQISANNLLLMKQCEQLLQRLMTHQYSWVFNTPVDVVKLNIPDYFTVIKTPMDLGTVKSKMRTGQYSNPLGFVTDVRLTFQNAMTYNPKGNDVHTMADIMSKFFEARWKSIEKKIGMERPVVEPTGEHVKKPVRNGEERENVKNPKTTGTLPKKRKVEERENVEVIKKRENVIKRRMSGEQKIGLSRRLESVVAELPEYIIDFIKRNISSDGQNGEDEIEIDIDSVSDDTLFELEGLLDEFMREKEKLAQDRAKNDRYETLNESGLSNSSMHKAKENEVVEEEVDIEGNEPPLKKFSPVVIEKETKCETSSSSSSSDSSSHDSDSSSSSGSGSHAKASSPPPLNENKDAESGPSMNREKKSSEESKRDEKEPNVQLDGDKQYRAALLKGRFADTILKAREKTLDQGAKKDPEKLKQEKEELEKLKREAKAKLEAEAKAAEAAAKAAEAARIQAEAEESMRRRTIEREAARKALQQMEKTVEINAGFMKGDEEIIGSGFKPGKNPLEQLGLFMKDEDDEDEEMEFNNNNNNNNKNNNNDDDDGLRIDDDVEEGEID